MFPNGLVILTQPVSALRTQIPHLLDRVASVVSDTVYIHLQPAIRSATSLHTTLLSPLACTTDLQSFISDIYGLSSTRCQNLDIRILLNHVTNRTQTSLLNYRLSKPLGVLMSDAPFLVDAWKSDRASILQLLHQSFSKGIQDELVVEPWIYESAVDGRDSSAGENSGTKLTTYDYVVCGGTWDRMHTGHRLLLSHNCLICEKQLTVGVTDEAMYAKKTLKELISPWEEREAGVKEFVQDIKPNINIEPVKIGDVFGPTTTRENFQCIVVSLETIKGATIINGEREKKGLKTMDVVTIDVVEDTCHAPEEEEKVSSSSQRRRLLGTLLRPLVPKLHLPTRPYRIGLTGGIASGKSNICREMEKLGAATINCDKLGHKAYEPGTACFTAVVTEFGQDIVTDKGFIDTKKLGPIVFSDKNKLEKLNSIVWPEILRLAEQEINKLATEGVTVVVLEAAVLLEAGWDKSVHEVWTTFVPRDEAIKRQVERNQLSEEQAAQRVISQITNEERIAKSNVVLCPLWEFDYTQKQVQKAWDLMQQRLPRTSSL